MCPLSSHLSLALHGQMLGRRTDCAAHRSVVPLLFLSLLCVCLSMSLTLCQSQHSFLESSAHRHAPVCSLSCLLYLVLGDRRLLDMTTTPPPKEAKRLSCPQYQRFKFCCAGGHNAMYVTCGQSTNLVVYHFQVHVVPCSTTVLRLYT